MLTDCSFEPNADRRRTECRTNEHGDVDVVVNVNVGVGVHVQRRHGRTMDMDIDVTVNVEGVLGVAELWSCTHVEL